jgi:poly(ribitol-phosphate) beta-N-acetylglucosaminyltransferase
MSVGSALKVSVVVPVYNPGRYLHDLLASLARQTMPAADFEVVFVDDGSTDATPARLATVAAAATNVRVLRIPNSGWPGRPRNLGLDEAVGDYVFFADHDDELGPEALERMHAFAVANDSDVVVGREVRRGKGWVAGPLFRQDVAATTVADMPELLLLLTPHKLFRRRLLLEHGIRFLEGPRRLEDHPFVMAAYFRASVISVLATTTCYYWHNRPDSAGSRAWDWHLYFASMHDVLDVVEAHTVPGPLRDRMLLHWYVDKGLRRLGTQLAAAGPREVTQLTGALRDLTLARFPASLDARLTGLAKVRAALLRAGAVPEIAALAAWEDGLELRQSTEVCWASAGRLTVAADVTLVDRDGEPVTVRHRDGRWWWTPPVDLAGLADGRALPGGALDLTAELRRTGGQVLARRRGEEEAVRLSTQARPLDRSGRDSRALGAHVVATLDPRADAGLTSLRPGLWDLEVVLRTCGLRVRRRLGERPVVARVRGGSVLPSGAATLRRRTRGAARRLRAAAGTRRDRSGSGPGRTEAPDRSGAGPR